MNLILVRSISEYSIFDADPGPNQEIQMRIRIRNTEGSIRQSPGRQPPCAVPSKRLIKRRQGLEYRHGEFKKKTCLMSEAIIVRQLRHKT
jgi:hypothetical protein